MRDQSGTGFTVLEPFTITVVSTPDSTPVQPLPGIPSEDSTDPPEPKSDDPESSTTPQNETDIPASETGSPDSAPTVRPRKTPTIPSYGSTIDPVSVPSVSIATLNRALFIHAEVNDESERENELSTRSERGTVERQFKSQTLEETSKVSEIDSKLMSQGGELWDDLDSQRDLVESHIQGDMIIVGTAGAAASSFTVGVVAWALRTGFLASGLLAQLPAWRAFDPTLIMQGFEGLALKNRETGDEETLEQLMDRQSRSIDE